MTEFTLDCFLESGNAYKAALMLELSGADWEPHRVAFFSGETRAGIPRTERHGRGAGSHHHTPHGDVVLSQSGAILDYLSASSAVRAGTRTNAKSCAGCCGTITS
jgi:glutathione S-transferase